MRAGVLGCCFAALIVAAEAAPAELVGRASVIDGDTIEIHGQRVRLYGIDAPESSQLCTSAGEAYRCGQQAALALADEIGTRTVRCEERDRDRYGRTVAVCFVGDEDINRWMVSQGWAIAYRRYSLAMSMPRRRRGKPGGASGAAGSKRHGTGGPPIRGGSLPPLMVRIPAGTKLSAEEP